MERKWIEFLGFVDVVRWLNMCVVGLLEGVKRENGALFVIGKLGILVGLVYGIGRGLS